MNPNPMPALPEREFQRLEEVVGRICVGMRLCHMRDADVEYREPHPSGFHEITWAVILDLAGETPLCTTWTQDRLGNPNRLALEESATVLAFDSVVVQDVSDRRPWSSIMGQVCGGIRPHTYKSNYARHPSAETVHDVLWGLEFIFPGLTFLVAAAWHGHADIHPIANDELVVAYTPDAVGRLVALRDGYEEHWEG